VFKSENFNFKSYFLMCFRLKIWLKEENFNFKHTNRIFFLNVLESNFLAFLIKNVFKSEMCCKVFEMCCEDFFVCLKVAPIRYSLSMKCT
jgi:hypothetical protein